MSQPRSVVDGPSVHSTATPRLPRIERFKDGGRRTVLLLGDPEPKDMHWNAELECSVPCFKPVACPFCTMPRFTKTQRLEGFASALVLNERFRVWEQAVVVFTKAGLEKLSSVGKAKGPPFRGRAFQVYKDPRPGRSKPMMVIELNAAPENYPALPEFDCMAVMNRIWFPGVEHKEPVNFIDPIPVGRNKRQLAAIQAVPVNPEKAALLTAKLHSLGLKNLVGTVEREAAPSPQGSPPDDSEPSSGGAEDAAVESTEDSPPLASSEPVKAAPIPAPSLEEPTPLRDDDGLSPEEAAWVESARRVDADRHAREERDDILSFDRLRVGEIVCKEQKAKSPPHHPVHRNGKAVGK